MIFTGENLGKLKTYRVEVAKQGPWTQMNVVVSSNLQDRVSCVLASSIIFPKMHMAQVM